MLIKVFIPFDVPIKKLLVANLFEILDKFAFFRQLEKLNIHLFEFYLLFFQVKFN